jgi:glycerate kinase
MAFFNVQLKSGVHVVLDASGVRSKIAGVDLLVTGEGKIDLQTLSGKVVREVAFLGSSHNIPVAAFCGTAELSNSSINKLGLQFLETLVSSSVTMEEAINNPRQILTDKAREFLKKFIAK